MNINDMVLVSVDDHVVEPPAPLRRPAAGEVRRSCPAVRHPCRWAERLGLRGQRDRQRRAERRRRPAGRGVRHGADLVRRVARRLLRHRRAREGHGCQRRARLAVLPVVPAVLRPALRPYRGQGRRARDGAGLQRLAHRRVVRHASRPLHPVLAAGDLGPAGARRRGAPYRPQGRACGHVLGEPVEARLAQLPHRPLGSVLPGVQRGRRRRLPAHRLVVAAGHHQPGRAHRLPDHPHPDQHRAGRHGSRSGRRCCASSPI